MISFLMGLCKISSRVIGWNFCSGSRMHSFVSAHLWKFIQWPCVHLLHLTGACLVCFNFQLDAKWQIFWLCNICIASTENVLKCCITSLPMSVWDTQYNIILNLIAEQLYGKKKKKKNLQITIFHSCIRNVDLYFCKDSLRVKTRSCVNSAIEFNAVLRILRFVILQSLF